ncbi:MAG: PspA/IM30 family protein [Alphaproteobacteria bacterium]
MFSTLKTLARADLFAANESLISANGPKLLAQKIRDAESAQEQAKRTLASLILQAKTHARQLEEVTKRIQFRSEQAQSLANQKKDALLTDVATEIAMLENEKTERCQTQEMLEAKIERLKISVSTTQRHLVSLRQTLIVANSKQKEAQSQKGLNSVLTGFSALREAKSLAQKIGDEPDQVEKMQIFDDLSNDLEGRGLDASLEDEGLGDPNKVTVSAVLARFQSADTAQ